MNLKNIKKAKRKKTLKKASLMIYHASRWILGIVFIYASYDKILNPAEFASAVYNYHILPDFLINLTALILPWLELFLGISLISGLFLSGSILICNLLLIMFTAALIFNLYRGLDISCGCFSTSPGEQSVGIWVVARDASFMCFSFYMLFFYFFHMREAAGQFESGG